MKIVFSFIFFLMAMGASAQRQYLKEWKRIDSLVEKAGLVKTALKEVNAIYTSAKKENNDVQVIKALVYRMSLNDQVSDSGRYENIALLEKEIATAKEPAKSILHSIAGSSYWQYLQMNRWQFYNRSTTKGYDNKDISTWTIDQLHERISSHFEKSVTSSALLKKTSLQKFDPVIIKGNVRYLRPTLFDLLAFRAVDYFRNDESDVSKPAYAFEIDDSAAFADAATFVKHKFVTNDSSSHHYRAIGLYQDILNFHLNDSKPDALIDADINRLEFVRNYGVHPGKDALFKEAVEKIISRHNGSAAAAPAIYQLANWYAEKARSYDPLGDTSARNFMNTARELCEKVIAFKAKSDAEHLSKNLIAEIDRKEISLKAEEVNTRNEPFRALITYRNITTAYVRVVKFDRAVREKLGQENWNDSYWKQVVGLPVIKTYSFSLPSTGDHQSHRVEIKIDSLPAGEYGLLVSSEKDFTLGKNPLALHPVHISDIAFMRSGPKFYVLNRKTGAPLGAAKVQAWEEYYSGNDNKRKYRALEIYRSDENGFFELKQQTPEKRYQSILLELTHGDDNLFITNQNRIYYYNSDDESSDNTQDQTYLFSDRSIYRPGQIVYFKGISVLKNTRNNTNSVIANRKITIYLYNANGEEVDSLGVTTNDFGSYSGKFNLPTGVLNGQFRITDGENDSEISIRVEEYKRPKFYVEAPAPAGTYRVNDTIKVSGAATSYAGNSINGAAVKYRVTRRSNFPLWSREFLPRIWPPYPSQPQEIAHGSATTDENGRFVVSFRALPDNSVPQSMRPTFTYFIYADVTDLNGETISSTTVMNVGYQAMKVDVDIPAQLHVDSLKSFTVRTTNMNDSFIRSEVKLSLYKLNAPKKIFRERYWEQPDQFIMNRQEYYQLFPYDIYSDENNKAKWAKEKLAGEITTSSSADGSINKEMNVREAGWYVIEALTKDKFGDTVLDKKYVLLYNDKIVSSEVTALTSADKTSAEPGEKINYFSRTNANNQFMIREITRNSRTERTLISAAKTSPGGELNITEADRGSIIIKTAFVENNRFYSNNISIDVPFTNKELKIEYTTYRDRTLPNSNEKWKVKISGVKGDKVAAELLTSMYDASLDELYPHRWSKPNLWDRPVDLSPWTGESNFRAGESQQRYVPVDLENIVGKEYDRLKVPAEGGGATLYKSRLRGGVPGIAVQRESRVMAFESSKVEDQVQEVQLEEIKDSALPPPEPQTENKNSQTPQNNFSPRKNFNETAFFFPDLKTDSAGNIEFSFTTPEALTKWNWRLLAHTKDLAFGFGEKTMVTQKELMVQPNAPRFLREGDSITFAVKVANMSDKAVSGIASMHFFDPTTNAEVTGLVNKINQSVKFNAPADQSVPVYFNVKIPSSYTKPLTWRIIATTDDRDAAFTDGEENVIPVLSNRMLVTETITLPVRNTKSKSFKFDKLLNSASSKTLKNNGLTVEFTSNPAWYAVQALPYLTEVKNENAEQIFNRFYANALAMKLANSFPRLKSIIEKWKTSDTSAFLSNLQKNQELKTVFLEETPWVLEAKNEAQQKKNIALLFDLTRMAGELNSTLLKLANMQNDGGFVWYNGGPADRYMTQYIVSGIGHLKKLGALPVNSEARINQMVTSAISFLDNELKKDYDRTKNKKVAGTMIAYDPVQYLYMRTFFPEIPVPKNITAAYNYYRAQAKQGWVKHNTYMRALIALTLQRTGDAVTAKKIIAALKESAISNEEMGMYWKDVRSGYYWYQAPIETQSVLVEAFSEIANDNASVNDMKTWLLKNKQTNNWKTTKATADACYALLLHGDEWLTDETPVTIRLGEKVVSSESKAEAGTGYFRAIIPADSVKPSMGNITVDIAGSSSKPSWGGLYWQYFEDLDKITGASTALKIDKKLFVQKNTDRGPVIEALDNKNTLHVGDRVKVRIEIRTDRDLEYVHLKDMRASAFEPVNVLSEYKWGAGLGYYESTKDASNNYFFGRLPKGTHVFEYDLFVTHTGSFNNGVATIQCMYAPEFSSHSEGIKVNVINQ
ncbi:MAG: alpha-2-macroglobulin [Chitinophagaceae bacterium]|nr:alpha-2-macroglobulin [Chitinophagaceae bacterium]